MAVIFSLMLRSIGHKVTVFGLSERIARQYGIQTTSSVYSGVSESDLVLLGGGAFFKRERDSPPEINSSIRSLADALEHTPRPIRCVSIGSDGVTDVAQLSSDRYRVVSHPSFVGGLVRLRRDESLREGKFEYCPDVLTATSEALCYLREIGIIPLVTTLSDEIMADKNVINVAWKRSAKVFRSLPLNSVSNVVFLRSHDPHFGHRSEIWFPFLPRFDNVNPVETAQFLSLQKSVISTKLHVGIVASSFGVPFKSLASNEKTERFIAEHPDLIDDTDGLCVKGMSVESQRIVVKRYLEYFKSI